MFVFSNLIFALAQVLEIGLTVFYWLILIRALLSWVSPDPFNPVVQFLQKATDPILEPIRRVIPPMAIDISPIIAFLLIIFLKSFFVQTLRDWAYRLGS